jgi:hypothetical protein
LAIAGLPLNGFVSEWLLRSILSAHEVPVFVSMLPPSAPP